MNEIRDRIKPAAIALVIVGFSNFGISVLSCLSGLLRLTGIGGLNSVPADEAQRAGFIFGTAFIYGIAVLGLVTGPIIAFGALQMLKGKRLGISRVAAMLSIVPFVSCCFFLSFPVGIWALVVLGKPDVKSFFRSN